MIKLIVLDLDGTALKNRKKLHPNTIAAVFKAYEKNIKVIIATGRSPKNTYHFAQKLKIADYSQHIICYNGANIINLKTSQLLVDDQLKSEDIVKIINLVKEHKLGLWGYGIDDKVAYILKKNCVTMFMSFFSKRKMIKVKENSYIAVYKFLVFGSHKRVAKLYEKLKTLKIQIALTKRKYQSVLEITAENANKKNATQFLANMWKINSNEILAIGDGSNDYQLLKWVGCSVAMANSSKEIINIAKNVTASNKDGGVGKAIMKYCVDLEELSN